MLSKVLSLTPRIANRGMHDDLVFAVDYSRILAEVLALDKGQISQLLTGTSLTAAQFSAMEGYISWPDQHRIITNALALYREPALGLKAGQRYSLLTHGLVGVATMAAPTVMDAFNTLIRYQHTRAQFANWQVAQQAGYIIVSYELSVEQDEVAVFLMEALSMSLLMTMQFLLGEKEKLATMGLTIAEPDYRDLYTQVSSCEIRFGEAVNYVKIPVEFCDLPIPTRDSSLQQWAVQQCEQQFEKMNLANSFTARTLAILRQFPGRAMNQDQLAYVLNVSPRTLLRRLKEEGTTYKQLVNEEHKRLAEHYLSHTDLTIECIADQLGYHDLSSFRRAFKRWFGMSPSQYPRT